MQYCPADLVTACRCTLLCFPFWSLEIHRENRSQYLNWINKGTSIEKNVLFL